MENASKALIIAGAILLAIVIISLGLIVVNNTRGTVDKSNLSEQEIQSFNAKFTAYEGDSVEGSRVNSLIQQVISTNQSTSDSGNSNFVCIVFPTVSLESNTNPYISVAYNDSTKKIAYGDKSLSKATIEGENFAISKRDGLLDKGGSSTQYSLSVKTGKNYKVSMQYDNKTGCIGGIIVEDK